MKSKTLKTKIVASLPKVENSEEALAKVNLALRPDVGAAAVISQYTNVFGNLDIKSISDSLYKAINQTVSGDFKHCEAMLLAQTEALQAVFVSMSYKAAYEDNLSKKDIYLKIAFKAQNQCRLTLETFANCKNPSIIFAKQANIAQGHQQINNEQSTL